VEVVFGGVAYAVWGCLDVFFFILTNYFWDVDLQESKLDVFAVVIFVFLHYQYRS